MSEELLLNTELLNDTYDDDAEGVLELLDMYWAQAEEIIAGLRTAIQSGNGADVNQLAHKLAGSSGVCGVSGMVQPLRTLELRGREGQLADADSQLAGIVQRLASCRQAVDEFLAQKNG